MGKASRRKKEQTRKQRVAGRSIWAPTFSEYVTYIQDWVETLWAGRNGDAPPHLFIESSKGQQFNFSLTSWDINDPGQRDVMIYQGIMPKVRALAAVRVAYTSPAWMPFQPKRPGDDPIKMAPKGSLRDEPNRVEAVLLHVIEKEHAELWHSLNKRPHPVSEANLQPWQHTDEGMLHVYNRFFLPIMDAMRTRPRVHVA